MLRLAILSGLLAIATVTWGQEAVGPVGAVLTLEQAVAHQQLNGTAANTSMFSSSQSCRYHGWIASASQIAITKSDIKTSRHEYYVRFLDGNNHLDSTLYVVAPPWTHFNQPSNGPLSSPDYTKMPPNLRTKLEAGDPIPPTRSPSTTIFYPTSYPCEYIRENNSIIDHGVNWQTLYAHLSGIAVAKGQQVARGDIRYIRNFSSNSTDTLVPVSVGTLNFWRLTAGVTFRF